MMSTGGEICLVFWPLNVDDKVLGKPTIVQCTDRKDAEKYAEGWMKNVKTPVSFSALLNGSTVESKNGMVSFTVRRGLRETAKAWAIRNHPNRKLRVLR